MGRCCAGASAGKLHMCTCHSLPAFACWLANTLGRLSCMRQHTASLLFASRESARTRKKGDRQGKREGEHVHAALLAPMSVSVLYLLKRAVPLWLCFPMLGDNQFLVPSKFISSFYPGQSCPLCICLLRARRITRVLCIERGHADMTSKSLLPRHRQSLPPIVDS